jgi:tetratricopeptide (TPR) repeat protein
MIARSGWGLVAILFVAASSLLVWYRSRDPVPAPGLPPNPQQEEIEPAVVSSIRTMRDRVLQEPQSAKAWGDLGKVFLANGLNSEARVCFIEAERREPANPSWPYLHGVILVGDGEHEAALPHYQRVIELTQHNDALNCSARLVLAETELYLGRPQEAETQIQYCRVRRPDDPRVRFDAGLVAMALEDWPTARDHLLLCLNNPYTRKKARGQLAAVYRRLNDDRHADELQKESSRVPADWPWPDPLDDDFKSWTVKKQKSFELAGELESHGHIDEATRMARALVERYPEDDFAQALLGRLLAQKGDFSGAIAALMRAIQLAPHAIHTHYNLSLILMQFGEMNERQGKKQGAEAAFQEAAEQARQALVIKPDYAYAQRALGLSLKHLGKTAEAAQALQEAVHCNPEFAELHLELAEVLFELGRHDAARIRFEEALRLGPPEAPWRESAQNRLIEVRKNLKKPGE